MSDEQVCRAVVTVTLADGLHLRPLTQIARVAQSFEASTSLRKGNQVADGKRPLDLMTLAAMCGEQLEVETRGVDADAAAAAIVALFECNFEDDQ